MRLFANILTDREANLFKIMKTFKEKLAARLLWKVAISQVNLLTAENRLNDFSTQFNFHSPEFIKCLKRAIKSVHYYLKYLTADTETAAVI